MAEAVSGARAGGVGEADRRRRERLEKLRFWRRACAEQSALVTRYNETAPGVPLLFFHGDFDMGGTYLRRIAGEAGQPIIAIAPHGIHGDGLQPSIEWMARERLALILAVQPAGPYRLGGYCNGALVAYECARLLAARGAQVDLVLMIEPASFNARPLFRGLHRALTALLPSPDRRPLAVQRTLGEGIYLLWSLSRILRLMRREPSTLVGQLAERARRRLAGRTAAAPAEERAVRRRNAWLKHYYLAASAAYLPPPTAVPVSILSSGRDGRGRDCGLYDGRPWQRLAANFRLTPAPGNHSSCLSDHASVVAARLADLLGSPTPT